MPIIVQREDPTQALTLAQLSGRAAAKAQGRHELRQDRAAAESRQRFETAREDALRREGNELALAERAGAAAAESEGFEQGLRARTQFMAEQRQASERQIKLRQEARKDAEVAIRQQTDADERAFKETQAEQKRRFDVDFEGLKQRGREKLEDIKGKREVGKAERQRKLSQAAKRERAAIFDNDYAAEVRATYGDFEGRAVRDAYVSGDNLPQAIRRLTEEAAPKAPTSGEAERAVTLLRSGEFERMAAFIDAARNSVIDELQLERIMADLRHGYEWWVANEAPEGAEVPSFQELAGEAPQQMTDEDLEASIRQRLGLGQ